jgi:hypothetical protein
LHIARASFNSLGNWWDFSALYDGDEIKSAVLGARF